MKTKQILCFMFCLVSCSVSAQLTVNSSGKIQIGTTSANGKLTVMSESSSTSHGVYSVLSSSAIRGAAILGSSIIGMSPVVNSRLAGYFYGNVIVSGSLYAATVHSGRSLNLPTSGLDDEMTSRLSGLQTVRFTEGDIRRTDASEQNLATDKAVKSEDVVHYGITGESLHAVFPDLVNDEGNGQMSVNYLEMVPILVQAINELSTKIEEQQAEIAELRSFDNAKAKTRSATGINTADGQVLSLGQNNPNPFSETTSIEVCVPDEITTATLFVYDMSGAQVEKIDINERGTTRVSFSGTGLKEGMYLYSLVADGRVVGTKKMVLTK